MAELKTKLTGASVDEFIAGLPDETRRNDAIALCKIMSEITKAEPQMWGGAIIGFGSRKLVYDNGRELDWMVVAFSPRKANTVLYLTLNGFDRYADLMAKLGKHKTSKACLYINKLADVDMKVLKELVKRSVKQEKSA